jgi:hypothetical protein
MLDPTSLQGAPPPNFDVDNVGEGQLSMTADNSFSFIVESPSLTNKPIVRIAQVASPVITHLIYCSLGQDYINVEGAKTFVLDNFTKAVIGNKLKFLGNLVEPTDFTPKEDYRQCRIMSMSDTIQYNGKIIDVNGNTYTAHVQSPLEVADISPNQIADSVRAPITKPITRVAQHKEPVYEYNYVEPNDSPQNGKDTVTLSEMFDWHPSSGDDSLWSNQAIQSGETLATKESYSTMITNKVNTMLSNTLGLVSSAFDQWFDSVDNRYGIYQDGYKTISIAHHKTFDPYAYRNGPIGDVGAAVQYEFLRTIYQQGFYEENNGGEKFQGTSTVSGVQAFLNHILSTTDLTSQINEWITAGVTPTGTLLDGRSLIGGRMKFSFTFSPRKSITLRMDDMSPYPSVSLESILLEEETAAFVDPHYKVSLTEITVDGSVNMLVASRCIYQLILNDKSVLAEYSKRSNSDPHPVNAKQLVDITKAVRALPPALIEGEAREQLASRGILGGFGAMLGPMLDTILPGSGVFMQQGGKILDGFL